MAGNVGQNTFVKGLNKDTDKKSQDASSILDGVNIDLVENGNFTALTNIRGTDKVGSVVHNLSEFDTANVLGAYEVRVLGAYLDGTIFEHDAILIFAAGNVAVTEGSSGPGIPIGSSSVVDKVKSFIYLYDTIDECGYKLFESLDEQVDALKFPLDGTVDAFYNKEKGENIVYFVDGVNDIRRLIVRLPFAQSYRDLFLRPLSGVDRFYWFFQQEDGVLTSGMYTGFYRYVNTETNKTTAWSPPTSPFPAIPIDGPNAVGGLPGEVTNKAIWFKLDKTTENSAGYNAVQLAIVKEVDGTTDPPTIAYVTEARRDWFDDPENIIYRGNEQETVVPIEDVVVEDAPIKTFKTINQKANRLFGGNVIYNNLLDYDNGDPTFTDAYAVNKALGSAPHPYRYPGNFTESKGYFREEVYRFGLVYHDKFGNTSPPFPLDFSGVNRLAVDGPNRSVSLATYSGGVEDYTDVTVAINIDADKFDLIEFLDVDMNSIGVFKTILSTSPNDFRVRGDASAAIWARKLKGDSHSHSSGDIPDFKFPARNIPEHSILDLNGEANALGLKITGIKNHPSWAVGFSVVRMERIEDIIFQTPHINTVAYQPVPTAGKSPWDTIPLDEQFLGIKKLSMGNARNITAENAGSDPTTVIPEYFNQDVPSTAVSRGVSLYMVATPPEYMFNLNGVPTYEYIHSPSHKAKIIDAVAYTRETKVNGNKDSLNQAYSVANQILAIDRRNYFYNRDGVIKIDSTGFKDVFYDKIEDQPWFSSRASLESGVTLSLDVTLNAGPVSLPETPFPGNWKLQDAVLFQNGTAISEQQGEHPSVSNSPTSGTAERFANPVENQRALLLKLDTEIEDYSRQLAFQYDAGSPRRDYVPLYPSAQKPDSRVYGETHLEDASTVNSFGQGGKMRSSNSSGSGQIAGGFYVMNIINGLADDRYGSIQSAGNFIFTGHYQPLTSSDIENNTEFEAEVFGGDCFITAVAIKINNSSMIPTFYEPANQDLNVNQGVIAGGSEWKLGSYLDYVELIYFWCESKVATTLQAQVGVFPNTNDTSVLTYNQDYLYPYNPDYSSNNSYKIAVSRDPLSPIDVHFPSRIAYSDQKVYNTAIEGFDRFRTNSIKDLDEQYGGITRLVKTSDSELYAIQETAVRYLPVGKELVELQDGAYQTLGSDLVVGNTILYLSTTKGSQNIRTVITQGDIVYGFDARKREIWRFQSKGRLDPVSDVGMYSFFKDNLPHQSQFIPDPAIMGYYDFNKKEYWLVYNDWTDKLLDKDAPGSAIDESVPPTGGAGSAVGSGLGGGSSAGSGLGGGVISGGGEDEDIPPPEFTDIARSGFIVNYNERINAWKTRINVGDNKIFGGVYANQELYTLSKGLLITNPDSAFSGGLGNAPGSFDLHTWHTSDKFGHLLGEYQKSTFDIVLNQDANHSKMFDVLILNANERLDLLNLSVENESAESPDQIASNVDLNVAPRDGKYYINKLRDDSRGSRLRGQFAVAHFEIDNTEDNDRLVAVTSILTKYRYSERNF